MPNLQRKLLIIFSIAVFLVIALFAGAAFNAQEELESNQLSQESFRRLILMDKLMSALLEAESSQRAYIIGNGEAFREQYQHYREVIDGYLRDLENPSLPKMGNVALIRDWQELISERVEHLDGTLVHFQTHGVQAAIDRVASNVGKQRMDQVREIANRLKSEEQASLLARNTTSESYSRQLVLLLGLAAILNLALLGGAYRITTRAIVRGNHSIRQLEERTAEIIKINQLSSSLQSCESIEESAEVFKHFMRLLFPGDSGGLYLMRASRNLLELISTWNEEAAPALAHVIEPQDCWGLRLGASHAMRAPGSDLLCPHQKHHEVPYICLPLLAQSEIIGLLHMQVHDQTRLPEIQLRAEMLATHAGAALAGIMLREVLRQQSVRDPLTDLYNRRYLEESLDRELLRAKRGKGVISIVILDVDHFKQFNDSFSHQAGDLLLREFAEYLQQKVRGDDIACRFGGEEFVLVLPGASQVQAKERINVLRQNMVSISLTFHGKKLPAVTASFGIATFPDDGEDRDTLIRLADSALYHAKHNGRNRVTTAAELTPSKGPSKLQVSS